MHIKKVTLQGFTSYKDRTDVGELSDGINVIVGQNGGGKSNILLAIELVLTGKAGYLVNYIIIIR